METSQTLYNEFPYNNSSTNNPHVSIELPKNANKDVEESECREVFHQDDSKDTVANKISKILGWFARDEANDTHARTIVIALVLFAVLFILSVVLIVTVVETYGVVAFAVLTVLCCIVLIGGWFLAKTLLEDPTPFSSIR